VEKNAASAIAAFDRLFADPAFASENPRLKLVLSGIKSLADLGIQPPREMARLVAIPHLSPARLEFLLQTARGLLYPSFNEGFGYPPLEAMSLGVPVVASNRTSIPEVCEDAAVYCDPFDLDSITAGIRKLLATTPDPKFLKSHAEKIGRRQSRDLRRLSELICGAVVKKIIMNKPTLP
jgi:glycosyltransferase involved in cell wall biosynthesis